MRSYPPARAGDDVDDYHGEAVSDPYRWLESTDDPETVGWIKAQNELTESFLSAVPAREAIRARLTELWNYPKYGVPFERGGRWFQSRNPGLAAQPVLHVMDAPDAQGRPLLDPNALAKDGTVALSEINVSCDGTLLAYATSDNRRQPQRRHDPLRDSLVHRIRLAVVASAGDRADEAHPAVQWADQRQRVRHRAGPRSLG